MLYLFGRLALSDSLDYHEDYQDNDYQQHLARDPGPEGPNPDASVAELVAADYDATTPGRNLAEPIECDCFLPRYLN